MYYVYSTLTCDTAYAIYAANGNKDLAVLERAILIRGGNGVATKQLFTPKGVLTVITDEDMKALENDYHFKEHVKLGFIVVEKKNAPLEKVVKNMKPKDASAPKVPEDYAPENQPKLNKGS